MFDADFLDHVWYHNTIRVWLIGLAVLAGTIFVLVVARRLAISRLEKIAARTKTEFDDLLVELLRRTKGWAIVIAAFVGAAIVLTLPVKAERGIHVLSVLALLLQGAIWGNGIIGFFTQRHLARSAADGHSATTITALGYAGRFVLGALLLLLALDNLGINITALVAGLGITGIAVALAVQNILGDLFGALSIVLDKPFVVGDTIAVDNFVGTVEHIGLKSTRLRSVTGEQLIMSNADLLRSRVRNYRRMFERRVDLLFGVTYDTPADTIAAIPALLREIVSAQKNVRFDRAHFKRFGDSALEFEAVYFVTVADYNVMMDTQQAVNLDLLRRFEAMAVRFAFPTRTVHTRVVER